MNRKQHWERVYSEKPADQLGWYRPRLEVSLDWIHGLGLNRDAPIIDIGGGASTLVEGLLDHGHTALTVLDLSGTALSLARARLGDRAGAVTWIEGDVTEVVLPAQQYLLWHDRAVFHFLTDPDQREAYREALLRALRPGGHMIIGTFAPEAPPKCSGLPVQRYDAEELADNVGPAFALVEHVKTLHVTPGGVEQMYLYCRFRRSD